MLTTSGNTGLAITSHNDVVGETWKRRDTTDEECSNGTPIGGEFGRVAVNTVEVVHIGYGDIAASDDVVAVAQKKTSQQTEAW